MAPDFFFSHHAHAAVFIENYLEKIIKLKKKEVVIIFIIMIISI